jgi:hypothetical protein
MKHRVGRTGTIAILPASWMALRIRRCSTPKPKHSCLRKFLAPLVLCCCCRSGNTRQGSGKPLRPIRGARHGTYQAGQHRTREQAPDSHVARTDQDEFGNIFRRNMPDGNVDDHGIVFVGFSSDQKRLSKMLDSMAGLITDTRDALTRFTLPLIGSYYFVPSVESLRRLR